MNMSTGPDQEPGGGWSRRRGSAGGQQLRETPRRTLSSTATMRGSCRDSASLKRSLSCEDTCPTALPVVVRCVRGSDRLPAEEWIQEELRGKLRVLQMDATGVTTLFMELCAHLISINSEENAFLVTFKTFEDIWKFTTYYSTGLLSLCLENLLMEHKFWLWSLQEDISVHVSVQDEMLSLMYKAILMQDGSLFAFCCTNQMFDSSTSGGDLYLEQGDIALFEPPFLGSGWTVLCLADGSRGTAPHPAVEPVCPFHQWFLKSTVENMLVGDGKPSCDFPLQFARGSCDVTEEYEAEGPDELSVALGDRIIIVGLLVSCFDWFMGRKESTGEEGLVKTSVVKPAEDISECSADILLKGEDGMFFSLREDEVMEETSKILKSRSHHDTGLKYKLDKISDKDSERKTSMDSSFRVEPVRTDLKMNIQKILDKSLSPDNKLMTMNGTQEDSALSSGVKKPSAPCFTAHPVVEGNSHTESMVSLFSFLERPDYRTEFGFLYRLTSDAIIKSTFSGHSDEDELVAFLGAARETARKKRLFWSQTRLCFLLGKLCAGKSKFSQARVYLEESLSVPQEGFTDLQLLASIYSNLATIYLLQNNTQSFFAVMERLVALLLGVPECLESLEDDFALKYMLKKAILSHNTMAEARATYLLAKHHWTWSDGPQMVPYLERLLVLDAKAQKTCSFSASHVFLTLGRLYSQMGLPHLSVCSARRVCMQPSALLTDCLSSMLLALDNISKTTELETPIPAQLAPYLHQVLTSTTDLQPGSEQHRVLTHQLTVCLCELFCKHRMVGHAISHMHKIVNKQQLPTSVPERNSALIWLAWLHINNNQPQVAMEILECLLDSMPEHCTTPQEGVVMNMRGVALGCMGDLQEAAESYRAAVDICQEFEDMANWAVAQANLGLLSLRAGSKCLAQTHLFEAVQLFSELQDEDHQGNFIAVLLELGQLYVSQQQVDYGKGCYEWALLLAINTNLLDCQLAATSKLIHLYGSKSPDQVQSLIYSQHMVHLLRRRGDRGQEGGALEVVSRLYLSLGTHRAYRVALDHTKTSLGIFIDLGCREKEALGWLQAGNIYHLLEQTELVDLYIQVAQDVALSTGDTKFILKLLEAAGDIFFNSRHDRDKAIPFYRVNTK